MMPHTRSRTKPLDEPPCKRQCRELQESEEQGVVSRQDNVDRVESLSDASGGDSLTTDLFQVIKGVFPRHAMDISSWISFFQDPRKPFCEGAYLVFSKKRPAVIVYIVDWSAAEAGDAGREKVKDLGNNMTREVTSVLQGFMTSPICIVPVFLDRRDLEASQCVADLLQEAVTTTLSSVKSLIPYGRWLMTESKFQAMQKAATQVLRQLEAAKGVDAAKEANKSVAF